MTDRIMTHGVAAADHSSNIGKFVKFDHADSDEVALLTDPWDTSSVHGVLENSPEDEGRCNVIVAGLAAVDFNGVVQPGQWFTNDTNARAVAYSGNGAPRGFALQQKIRDTASGNRVRAVLVPTLPGLKLAKASYDFAVDGGAQGAFDLGVELPSGAVILQGVLDMITTATSTAGPDNGTGAITVGGATLEAAIAINDASNPWDAGLRYLDVPAKTTSEGNITFTIGTDDWTAGKFDVYLIYTDA